jgi:hypothetical protein
MTIGIKLICIIYIQNSMKLLNDNRDKIDCKSLVATKLLQENKHNIN